MRPPSSPAPTAASLSRLAAGRAAVWRTGTVPVRLQVGAGRAWVTAADAAAATVLQSYDWFVTADATLALPARCAVVIEPAGAAGEALVFGWHLEAATAPGWPASVGAPWQEMRQALGQFARSGAQLVVGFARWTFGGLGSQLPRSCA